MLISPNRLKCSNVLLPAFLSFCLLFGLKIILQIVKTAICTHFLSCRDFVNNDAEHEACWGKNKKNVWFRRSWSSKVQTWKRGKRRNSEVSVPFTHTHTNAPPSPSRLRVMDFYQGNSIRADFDESLGCSAIPFEIPFFSSLVQVARGHGPQRSQCY